MFDPVTVGGKDLSKTQCAKILGVTISNDLKWNNHVNESIKKANKRLYFLILLKRAGVSHRDIIRFYSTVIRPVLEYGSPVFHHSLPDYLSNDLEQVQKRAMSIIAPCQSYRQSLDSFGLCSLRQRRDDLCSKVFTNITSTSDHSLAHLLPPRHQGSYNLRRTRTFQLPRFRTNRFKNSFIPAMCQSVNSNL